MSGKDLGRAAFISTYRVILSPWGADGLGHIVSTMSPYRTHHLGWSLESTHPGQSLYKPPAKQLKKKRIRCEIADISMI